MFLHYTVCPHLLSIHSGTHWDRSKSLRYQIAEIHDALVSVTEPLTDPAMKHEALTLYQKICDFSFMVMPYKYREQGDAIQYHGNKFCYATVRISTKYLTEYRRLKASRELLWMSEYWPNHWMLIQF
jgi:hypothetical protein